MKSDREWKYWGSTDPLFAVASWKGKERGKPDAWTPEEFLNLGSSDMQDVLRHWKDYGLSKGKCVEIGCGSGRMTKFLAETFESVVAIDVSPDQIANAKKLLGDDAEKIEFQVVTEPVLPTADATAIAVFSSHVFQHLPDFSGIESYLKEAFRTLTSGGSICVHLAIPGTHRRRSLFPLRNACARLLRLFGYYRIMEFHQYKAVEIFEALAHIGFIAIELRVFPLRSNGDFHPFFFARKP